MILVLIIHITYIYIYIYISYITVFYIYIYCGSTCVSYNLGGLATSGLSTTPDPWEMLRSGEPAAGQPRRLRKAPGPFGALFLLRGWGDISFIDLFTLFLIDFQ